MSMFDLKTVRLNAIQELCALVLIYQSGTHLQGCGAHNASINIEVIDCIFIAIEPIFSSNARDPNQMVPSPGILIS